MQKQFIINEYNENVLKNGGVAVGVDFTTMKPAKLKEINGVICEVKSQGAKDYQGVVLYTAPRDTLNLTEKETETLLKNRVVQVYRSSGYKDGDKVTTRETQIALGVARNIIVKLNEHNEPYIESDSGTSCEVITSDVSIMTIKQ